MSDERSFIEQALLDLNTAAYFDDSRKQDEVERRIAEHVDKQDAEIARLTAEVARLSAARTQDAARYVASTPDSIAVPHSSSAVLGYSVASPTARDLHPWVLTDRYLNTIDLDPAVPLPDEVDLADGECIVAVVRIGTDGRIGS